jgi:thiol-disulfide isomerase/thioredoxin
MKYQAVAAWVLLSVCAHAQSASPDARAILKSVGTVYRAPFSLVLKGTKIHEQHDEFNESIYRTPFTLLLTPDNECRMESKSNAGTSIQVCDGEKTWNYFAQTNKYFANASKLDAAFLLDGRVDLRMPTSKLQEANLLRQEVLETDGAKRLCDVIEASYDRKQAMGSTEFGPVTLWVEHDTYLVWKMSIPIVMNAAGSGRLGGKTTITETTLFSSIQSNVDLPPGTFAFTPPSGATEQKTASDDRWKALIGRPAPDFTLRDLAGKDLQLASLKGKVILLDFWATWCGPCVAEMPKLDLLSKEFKEKDVVVLGIDAGEDEETVRSFIKKNPYQLRVLLSSPEDRVLGNYAAYSYPSTVVIDRNGIVADYKVGFNDDAEQTLRAEFVRVSGPGYVPPTPSTEPNVTVTAASMPIVGWPDPVTSLDFVHRGYRNLRDKNYPGAIRDADAALHLQSDHMAALRLRAQASYDAKDYQMAIEDYTAILKKYPDWGQLYERRGLAYSYWGKHSQAIPDYTRALELDPYLATPYNNRGWAYLESGAMEDALRDLNRAIDLSPEYTRAYENRAKVFDQRNDLSSELADLEMILRVSPTNQWARSQRDDVRKRSESVPKRSPGQ